MNDWKDVLKLLATPGGVATLPVAGASAIGDKVAAPARIIAGGGELFGKMLANFANKEFWQRVGVGYLGYQMILIGLVVILASTRQARNAVSAATSVATKGIVK